MRELTPIEKELVDYLVAYWGDPASKLPQEFYRKLSELGRHGRERDSVHRLLTEEVTNLRSSPHAMHYRRQYNAEQDYRQSLRLRAAGRSLGPAKPSAPATILTPTNHDPQLQSLSAGRPATAQGHGRVSDTETTGNEDYRRRFPQEWVALDAEMTELGRSSVLTDSRGRLLEMGARRMDIAYIIGFPTSPQDHQCQACKRRIYAEVNVKCPACGEHICECGACAPQCPDPGDYFRYIPPPDHNAKRAEAHRSAERTRRQPRPEVDYQPGVPANNGSQEDEETWTDYWNEYKQSASEDDDRGDATDIFGYYLDPQDRE